MPPAMNGAPAVGRSESARKGSRVPELLGRAFWLRPCETASRRRACDRARLGQARRASAADARNSPPLPTAPPRHQGSRSASRHQGSCSAASRHQGSRSASRHQGSRCASGFFPYSPPAIKHGNMGVGLGVSSWEGGDGRVKVEVRGKGAGWEGCRQEEGRISGARSALSGHNRTYGRRLCSCLPPGPNRPWPAAKPLLSKSSLNPSLRLPPRLKGLVWGSLTGTYHNYKRLRSRSGAPIIVPPSGGCQHLVAARLSGG